MSIAAALLYQQLTSLAGLIRWRLRRLKQPKYLAGAVVGGAYLYFMVFRHAATGYGEAMSHAHPITADVAPVVMVIGSAVLLIFLLLNWVVPRPAASLAFTEAEITFLFPAPVSRSTLVHFRLLRAQLALLLSSVILGFFSNRWTWVAGSPVSHMLGWWIILSTLTLHATASSFVITRLALRGVRPFITHTAVLLVLLGLVVAALRQIAPPSREDFVSQQTVMAYLTPILTAGPIDWLLALPRLVLGPFMAADWPAFARALPGALVVLGAHYAWAVLVARHFEEASLARAEKRAARLKARREGTVRSGGIPAKARRARFHLGRAGRPEIAFLWKNLLATPPVFSLGTALLLALAIAGGRTWLWLQPANPVILQGVVMAAAITAVYALLLGPQVARCDLRTDLLNADLLKTYPLPGWQIIAGELLAPVAILTAILWLALLAAVLSIPLLPRVPWATIPARAGIALGLALLAPALTALQLLTPNALTVLFPAWAQSTANRAEQGLDVIGQRLIFVLGQLFLTALLLVPPVLGGAAVFAVVYYLAGPAPAAIVSCLAALIPLLIEVSLGVRWLGALFERTDLAAEVRA